MQYMTLFSVLMCNNGKTVTGRRREEVMQLKVRCYSNLIVCKDVFDIFSILNCPTSLLSLLLAWSQMSYKTCFLATGSNHSWPHRLSHYHVLSLQLFLLPDCNYLSKAVRVLNTFSAKMYYYIRVKHVSCTCEYLSFTTETELIRGKWITKMYYIVLLISDWPLQVWKYLKYLSKIRYWNFFPQDRKVTHFRCILASHCSLNLNIHTSRLVFFSCSFHEFIIICSPQLQRLLKLWLNLSSFESLSE